MTVYTLAARENLSPDLVAIVDAEIAAAAGVTTSIETTQYMVGMSFDRVNREILYSACIAAPAAGPFTNATGYNLWSGLHTIADAAAYDAYSFKNFSVMRHNIDTGAVTRNDCWSSSSAVPNGIGGSDGTFRRFVEADLPTPQMIKLVDPRTGNLWSHHTTSGGLRSCMIYEFRRSEDFEQTISPYMPDANRHLELFGINADWVLVGDFEKLTNDVYAVQGLPRLRTSDEVAADELLSYFEFDGPAATGDMLLASAMSSDGGLWWFGMVTDGGGALDCKLYKLTMPTSAPFGGPVVGGGWTDETPWAAATGPNARAATYRGSLTSTQPLTLLYQPAANMLVAIDSLYPGVKYPTPTTNPNDFAVDVTYVDVAGGTFEYWPGVITGYMTAAWEPTTVAADAAYAVSEVYATDGDLSYHSFDFTGQGVDYTKRWLVCCVQDVVAGVITGAYPAASPFSSRRTLFVEYQFVAGSAPAKTGRIHPEDGWNAAYPTYAAYVLSQDDNGAVHGSLVGIPPSSGAYDSLLWVEDQKAWWASGQNSHFRQFDATFTVRGSYVVQPPFLKIGFSPDFTPGPDGQVMVHTRIGAP